MGDGMEHGDVWVMGWNIVSVGDGMEHGDVWVMGWNRCVDDWCGGGGIAPPHKWGARKAPQAICINISYIRVHVTSCNSVAEGMRSWGQYSALMHMN